MNQIYPHILPNVHDWPVAKLSAERADFIERLNHFVINQILEEHQNNLSDLISKTIYLENQRIKFTPWKVDPADDKEYWKNIAASLESAALSQDKAEMELTLLKKIVNRYNEEIVGNFSPKTFLFSRIFLTSFFKRIFQKYFAKHQWRWGNKADLQLKIIVKGNVPLIRSLFEKGSVVFLPTHYSNLDSIMVGYAIDTNVGLPSFSYGAGLNLYNVELVAYFIDRLGAFKVDRRKKNPIYLECLKSMTGYSVIEGVNCLFFPGGTRSRSGQTEDKLKLGLINSVLDAQRIMLEKGNSRKVFVVPLNIGYHFVLEAAHLIDQHLQIIGKEKYKKRRSGGPTFGSIIQFLKDIYTKSAEVYMSFGDPLDVFGNKIDAEGRSIDKFGHEVNLNDYFTFDGTFSSNSQREGIYAKILGESIVESFHKYNVILSTHVIAFVGFHLIYEEYKEMGLMHLVNQSKKYYFVELDDLTEKVGQLIQVILHKEKTREVTISDETWTDIPTFVQEGLDKLGMYHASAVLKKEGKRLKCEDIRLLYFYHNRLVNYGFEAEMAWSKVM